jgi:hypothetical protein
MNISGHGLAQSGIRYRVSGIFAYTLLLLLAFGAILPASSASAAGERCFPETGFCITGAIRTYWERNGGLPVFGFPISDLRTETVEGSWTGPVQWFERDRLEDHNNEGLGVLAGRLGARYLELQGRPWAQGNEGPRPGRNLCIRFQETGYNVCPPFSYYWEHNGGLERFGYPISPAMEETVEGRTYLVQYFERRRMEYHPENQQPYDILLGLLGREVYIAQGSSGTSCPLVSAILHHTWEVYAQDQGCPRAYVGVTEGIGIATQSFEGGTMLWLPRPDGAPGHIFVVTPRSDGGVSWEIYIDSYIEGEQVGTDELPPPGKFAPVRGFGKLWRTVPEVRQSLGWATSAEQADTGAVVQFSVRGGFSWMIHRASSNMVYILRADGPSVDVPRE